MWKNEMQWQLGTKTVWKNEVQGQDEQIAYLLQSVFTLYIVLITHMQENKAGGGFKELYMLCNMYCSSILLCSEIGIIYFFFVTCICKCIYVSISKQMHVLLIIVL